MRTGGGISGAGLPLLTDRNQSKLLRRFAVGKGSRFSDAVPPKRGVIEADVEVHGSRYQVH